MPFISPISRKAEKAFFDSLYPRRDLYDFRFILAHVRCDFIRQATLRDRLTLHMRVGDIGRKSFKLYYELTDRIDYETVFARAVSVQVCFNYRANETVRVSDELKRKLSEFKGD